MQYLTREGKERQERGGILNSWDDDIHCCIEKRWCRRSCYCYSIWCHSLWQDLASPHSWNSTLLMWLVSVHGLWMKWMCVIFQAKALRGNGWFPPLEWLAVVQSANAPLVSVHKENGSRIKAINILLMLSCSHLRVSFQSFLSFPKLSCACRWHNTVVHAMAAVWSAGLTLHTSDLNCTVLIISCKVLKLASWWELGIWGEIEKLLGVRSWLHL